LGNIIQYIYHPNDLCFSKTDILSMSRQTLHFYFIMKITTSLGGYGKLRLSQAII